MPEEGLTRSPETKTLYTQNEETALNALVERAMKGNSAALIELCAKITKSVFFHAMRLVGNQADAEDVMQEVCLRVCENVKTLRKPEAFRGWLSRITTNEAREQYRKNAKHGVVLNIDDYLESIMESNGDFLPEEYAQKEEYRQAIVEIIDSLPRRQREAVMLRYFGDLSVTEVAKEMQVGPPRITEYLALAREKLKLEMQRREIAPESSGANGVSSAIVLGSVLSRQCEFATPGADAIQRALARCEAAINAPVEAAKTSLAKTVRAGLALVLTAALATAGVIAGVWHRNSASLGQMQAAYAPAQIEGSVIFSGGQERGAGNAYLNPKNAALSDETGELEALEWWVTSSGRESEIIISGEGNLPRDALAAITEDGVYMLYFRVRNAEGSVGRLGRSFRVANVQFV
jgi:RNA polymerase sigma-70 factor (ECF subfamily)